MSPKQPASKDPVPLKAVTDPTPSAGSIEQIRDIIFGTQMQEYAERFAALETRLVDENRALQESLAARIDEALKALEEERHSRKAGFDDLLDQLSTQTNALRNASDTAQQSLGDELESVRQQLQQQSSDAEKNQEQQLSQFAGLFRQLAEQLERTGSK